MAILVFGNAGIDRTFQFEQLPRPGESVMAESERIDLGGKGANQAVAARRCGSSVMLATSLGHDANGDKVRASLLEEGVALVELKGDGSTDEHIILLDRGGRNIIFSRVSRAAELSPRAFDDAMASASQYDYVILQATMSLDATVHCASEARRRGATVVINPSPIRYDFDRIWPVTDVVILNEIEACEVGGSTVAAVNARRVLSYGPSMVVVTLGEQGAQLFSDGEDCFQPAPAVVAVDTTGAGDVFCGAFVAGVVQQLDPTAALKFAVTLASVSVKSHGAQSSFPSRAEALSVLQEMRNSS